MRGDYRPIGTAATIIDAAGTAQYHIVPTRLVMFGIACLALLLIVTVILAFLVLNNVGSIQNLREKVNKEETQRNDK